MIDIVVPVFNEGANIEALFERIDEDIKTSKNVLVVYDFDEDDTLPVVEKVMDRFPFSIKLAKNTLGRGVLNAIKTGFSASNADAVLVVMADLSDSLGIVDDMYGFIRTGHDLICGSRYMKGGKQVGGPLLKRTFSRIAGVSLHYLTGIPTHDVTNSFKMYSCELLHSTEIESNGGFELGMELTVKAFIQGRKIAELPSVWTDRVAGTSNFKMWTWLPKYIHWYWYAISHTWFSKCHPQNMGKRND